MNATGRAVMVIACACGRMKSESFLFYFDATFRPRDDAAGLVTLSRD
jgi:hypothetical protein